MKIFWVVGVVIVIVSGCGYRFSSSGELPNHVRHVYVAMLENHTPETGVESTFTNDLIYEFSRAGTLARAMGSADARLTGAIEGITRQTVSRIGIHTSQERRVTLTISLRLVDPKGNTLWSARMSDNEAYLVEVDKATTESNMLRAIDILCKRLAEKVYYRLADNF
jgi:outer membrane lipopolysaccharide assembly protein LptE/RlpB